MSKPLLGGNAKVPGLSSEQFTIYPLHASDLHHCFCSALLSLLFREDPFVPVCHQLLAAGFDCIAEGPLPSILFEQALLVLPVDAPTPVLA